MSARTVVALLALAAGISAASADSFLPADEVEGHPGATYLDLVRLIVPDAELVGETDEANGKHPDAVGHTLLPVRHLDPTLGGPPPAELVAQSVEAWPLRADDAEYMLIKLDFGRNESRSVGTSVLALLDAELKLVDAAEFSLDVYVHSEEVDPVAVGPENDGVVFNHQYDDWSRHTLVYVHNARLGQTAAIQSFEDYDCTEPRQTWAEITVTEEAGKQFWPLTMTHHDNRGLPATLTCSELADMPSPVVTSVTYRWDDAKGAYVGDHSALDAVAATLPARTE